MTVREGKVDIDEIESLLFKTEFLFKLGKG